MAEFLRFYAPPTYPARFAIRHASDAVFRRRRRRGYAMSLPLRCCRRYAEASTPCMMQNSLLPPPDAATAAFAMFKRSHAQARNAAICALPRGKDAVVAAAVYARR